MRKLFFVAGALAAFGSTAFADEVEVKPVLPGVVIEHRAADEGTTTKTVRHDDNGCTTRSVTHSNDGGDSTTHTRTNC